MNEAVAIVKRQLINIIYHNKALWNERWFGRSTAILVVEKLTLSDGRRIKRVVILPKPTVRYYMTAPAYREAQTLALPYIPLDQCEPHECDVEKLDKEIAELTDQQNFYRETSGPGSSRRRRKLHDHRWIHGSDAVLADHYMDRYMEHWKSTLDTTTPLDHAYGDVEVDPIDHRGFPDEFSAPCPINLLTYFHMPSHRLTLFATRTMSRPNPQIAAFEAELESHQDRILCEVNRAPLEKASLIPANCPWTDIAALLGQADDEARSKAWETCRCVQVEILFHDTELEAILAFLNVINEVDRPDTMAFWNASFDINTIMNRLRKLGVDPEEAFTPLDFGRWCLADYQVDTFNTQESDRGDTFTAASYTIWVDQMLLYASLRKQAGKKDSYSLDFTLRAELGEGKLAYEGSIRDFAYRDYARFMTYGALDVVPMATLEEKTDDIATAYQLSQVTRTRFHKVMKKTVCLRNLAVPFFRERGFTLSNNHNRNRERTEEAEKFQGGFVADPRLMEATGTEIGGSPSDRIFDDVVDEDAAAMYPSILLAFNIDALGQLGRLMRVTADGQAEKPASDLAEAWAAGDDVELGKRWFGLPGLGELAADVLGMPDLVLKEAPSIPELLEAPEAPEVQDVEALGDELVRLCDEYYKTLPDEELEAAFTQFFEWDQDTLGDDEFLTERIAFVRNLIATGAHPSMKEEDA